jgi:hypothetical protein
VTEKSLSNICKQEIKNKVVQDALVLAKGLILTEKVLSSLHDRSDRVRESTQVLIVDDNKFSRLIIHEMLIELNIDSDMVGSI